MVSDTAALSMEHSKRYLLQFALQKDPIEAKRYVTACFGKSMYSDRQQAELEKKLCVGNHKTVTCFLPEVFHRRKSSLYLMRLTTKESAGKFLHLKKRQPCNTTRIKSILKKHGSVSKQYKETYRKHYNAPGDS